MATGWEFGNQPQDLGYGAAAGDQYRKQFQYAGNKSIDDLASGRSSVALQQYYRGLGAANQAMQQQAVGRGANPLGERAAILQGGQNMRASDAEAAALRAQEMQAAQARQQQMMMQGAGMYFARQQYADQVARQRWEDEQRAKEQGSFGQALGGALGTLGQAAGMGAMMSGAECKEGIEAAGQSIPDEAAAQQDDLLRQIELAQYRYRPEIEAAQGVPPEAQGQEKVGVIAQDLARNPIGAHAVVQTPLGTGIDRDQALGLALGLEGRLGQRVDQLEAERQPIVRWGQTTTSRDVARDQRRRYEPWFGDIQRHTSEVRSEARPQLKSWLRGLIDRASGKAGK
jgi:hypothetical protein